MNKTVGFVELNYHSQNTYYLSRIAKENYNVILFVDEKIEERLRTFPGGQLNDGSIEWVVKKESENPRDYFRRVRNISERLVDMLFFSTITGNSSELYQFAKTSEVCPSAMYVYKVNNWLDPKLFTSFDLRKFVRENIRSILRKYVVSKQNMLLSEYQTGAKLMSDYHTDTNVQILRPLFQSDWGEVDEPMNNLRLVVPGAIKKSRGIEYNKLISHIDEYPENIVIDLLGRPDDEYGEKIVQSVRDSPKFRTHTEWIPHAEFASSIKSADFLIGPFTRSGMKWKAGSRYEKRSISVGSGITLDAIKYTTPLILPEYFQYDPELEPAVLSYESLADLPSIIKRLDLNNNNEIDKLTKGINMVAQNYSLEAQQSRFKEVVEVLTES